MAARPHPGIRWVRPSMCYCQWGQARRPDLLLVVAARPQTLFVRCCLGAESNGWWRSDCQKKLFVYMCMPAHLDELSRWGWSMCHSGSEPKKFELCSTRSSPHSGIRFVWLASRRCVCVRVRRREDIEDGEAGKMGGRGGREGGREGGSR